MFRNDLLCPLFVWLTFIRPREIFFQAVKQLLMMKFDTIYDDILNKAQDNGVKRSFFGYHTTVNFFPVSKATMFLFAN